MIGIYMILNKINNKKYVGQSINIEERFSTHKRQATYLNMYFSNYPLYRAIRKYNIDNFDFIIIEECPTKDLNFKEQYWIKYYETYGSKGYNMTPGGAGVPKVIPEEVIQLYQDGIQIPELIEIFNCTESTIINILHKKGLGYLSQYEKNNLQPDCHAVEQYNLNGEYISSYYSLGAASVALYSLGLIKSDNPRSGRSAISTACHNQTSAYNFLWKFKNSDINIIEVANKLQEQELNRRKNVSKAVIKRCSKQVNQYTLDGHYITTFPSAVSAGQFFNTSHGPIARVCRGEGKNSHGYLWRYVSEDYPIGKDLNIN